MSTGQSPKPKIEVPEPPAEAQIPHMQIELGGAPIGVARHPTDPDARAILVGPLLVSFMIPLDGTGAREIQAQLAGGFVIAPGSALPPAPAEPRRGRMAPRLKRR